ncbi:MAG: carbonic anhydrase [Xanthomonadaceae bacterium]|nr:carbonic anhydrase [Xanthomonadaceae bacterium]
MQGPQLDAEQALARLREGNRRFVDHVVSLEALLSHARREDHARAQRPFAVILGCSDSRAPAEFVFDQGLGDLFVIRVAGNIAAPSQIGSVEFAVARFGIRLVVVLGHSNCGAIQATLEAVDHPQEVSPALHAIVDRIMPALGDIAHGHAHPHDDDARDRRAHDAMRANVSYTAARLRADSTYLDRMCDEQGLSIVGADYDLSSGVVDFFHAAA